MRNIYQNLIGEYKIKANESNLWEETYGFENQYRCKSAVYLMKIISLKLRISTDR